MQTRRTFLLRAGSAVAGLASLSRLPVTEVLAQGRTDFDLNGELATVRDELQVFEQDYLPALLAPRFLEHDHDSARLLSEPEVVQAFDPRPLLDSLRPRAAPRPLWRAAIRQLRRALPGARSCTADAFDSSALHRLFTTTYPELPELLDALPAPAFTLIRGRLRWGIIPYRLVAADPDSLARCALGRLPVADADAPDPLREIRCQLPRIRQWILGLPPLSNENFAVLAGVLPALALVDPHLPAVALDRQRMKAAIRAGRGTNPHKKAEELRTLVTRFFTGCLCCGLALTVQSLANNHFGAIGRLLRYPEWYADSFWLGLAPKVVAAVLLQKVIALRGLVQRRR